MNTGTGDQAEPGAEDNRLSLNPNDPRFEEIGEWQDGKRYSLSNVVVEQISPGEFRVVEAEIPGSSDDEQSENPSDEAEQRGTGEAGAYENPAVAGMMGGKQTEV